MDQNKIFLITNEKKSSEEIKTASNIFNPLLNDISNFQNSNLFEEYDVSNSVRLINFSDHFDNNNIDIQQPEEQQPPQHNFKYNSTSMMDTSSAPSSLPLSNGNTFANFFSHNENLNENLLNNDSVEKKG
jgi:hypothetical protein